MNFDNIIHKKKYIGKGVTFNDQLESLTTTKYLES